MLARDTLALKPETSNSLELGLKSTLFDKRVTLNAALFKTGYANYQANFYDTVAGTVVTRLINAGDVSTRGLEIDIGARPLPQLRLTAAAAYTEAIVDNVNCPPAAAASCNLSGKALPFAPRFKSFLRGTWSFPWPAACAANSVSITATSRASSTTCSSRPRPSSRAAA